VSREGSIKREEIYEMMGKEKEEMIGSVDFFPVFFLSRSTIDAAGRRWMTSKTAQRQIAFLYLEIYSYLKGKKKR
jgi:hypothetical protein